MWSGPVCGTCDGNDSEPDGGRVSTSVPSIAGVSGLLYKGNGKEISGQPIPGSDGGKTKVRKGLSLSKARWREIAREGAAARWGKQAGKS